MARPAFPGVEMGMGRKRGTRRSRFLDRLPESCPRDAWLALAGEARGAGAGARGATPTKGRTAVELTPGIPREQHVTGYDGRLVTTEPVRKTSEARGAFGIRCPDTIGLPVVG